jgi:hypothetical protein
MIIEVHVAFLLAALSVLFGITYSLGMFLDKETKRVIEERKQAAPAAEIAGLEA